MGRFKPTLKSRTQRPAIKKKKEKGEEKKKTKKPQPKPNQTLKAQDWQKSFFKRKELGGGDKLGEDCQAVEKFNKFHVTLKTVVRRVAQGQ